MTHSQLPADPLDALVLARDSLIQAAGALTSTAPEQDRDTRLAQYPPVLTELLESLAELTTRLAVQTDATSHPSPPGMLGEVDTAEQPAASQHLHALLTTLNDAASHAAEAAAVTDHPDGR